MVFKMERGCPLVPLWNHCCYRNTKREIQGKPNSILAAPNPMGASHVVCICMCVVGSLSAYKEVPFRCNMTKTLESIQALKQKRNVTKPVNSPWLHSDLWYYCRKEWKTRNSPINNDVVVHTCWRLSPKANFLCVLDYAHVIVLSCALQVHSPNYKLCLSVLPFLIHASSEQGKGGGPANEARL